MKRSSAGVTLPTFLLAALCGCDGTRDEGPARVDGSTGAPDPIAAAPRKPVAEASDGKRLAPTPGVPGAEPPAAAEDAGASDDVTEQKPTVYFGKPVIKGSLSKRIILRILKRRASALLACYQRGLKRKPNLRGRVAVKFVIAPTGLVQHASVGASTLGDEKVERCVTETIKRTRFPSCGGGGIVMVTVPVVFAIK
jgi:TonB family protein